MNEILIQKFDSKKNKVFLVERNNEKIVKKVFSTKESFEKELSILTLLQGSNVPKLISFKENEILMEYIEGKTLLDSLLCSEIDDIEIVAELLIECINSNYKTLNAYPNDLNFRNFIIKNNTCFAIDFEEYDCTDFENCLAKITAFSFLYDIDSKKNLIFVNALLEFAKYDFDLLFPKIKNEISFLCKRRNISFDDIIY